MAADVRAEIEAVAKGKSVEAEDNTIVNEAIAGDHQAAFVAWERFAIPLQGEPIMAPAELLTPLP